ncbi:hypothetical protein [Flavobacterium urumqiense]|uniref:Uncharacterized protein n=1 Tax=Flavobacterium urumqiense TaxID=935224 RepID=A0A1H5ZXP5_9FLAO|nr:hypothetical protein [Flavobacterium urumqiense]SEG40457.1 hypothetical protein SAMN04488130_11249 [Flavobacterium urumqiense]
MNESPIKHYLGISENLFFLIFVVGFFIFIFISGHYKIKAEKEKQKKEELAGAKAWLEYQNKRFNEVIQKNNKKDSNDL